MRNVILFVSFFSVFLMQCKKNESPAVEPEQTEITAQINGIDVEIDDFILTNEIEGLRIYLRAKDNLISIYTNKREIGTYVLYEKEDCNFSGSVCVFEVATAYVSSGEVIITFSSDGIFSGSFNISTSPWAPDVDVCCNFKNVKKTDYISLITGTYIGMGTAPSPFPEMWINFDYNSKEFITKANNNNIDIKIVSNDGRFEDVFFEDRYVFLNMYFIDNPNKEITVKKHLDIFERDGNLFGDNGDIDIEANPIHSGIGGDFEKN